jgi:hypothetical protein
MMLLLPLCLGLLPAEGPLGEQGPPYEVLRPDAAWCGPRILYFFACYLDRERPLPEVVSLCATDAEGYTSMRDLVEAARALDLDPTPVRCRANQLLALGGPAILCVGRPETPGAKVQRLHFVGLVGRQGDKYLVVDPSLRAEPIAVSGDRIAGSFTGHAVLLDGCPRPWLIPSPMRLLGLGAAGLAALGGVVWLRRRQQGEAPQARPEVGR